MNAALVVVVVVVLDFLIRPQRHLHIIHMFHGLLRIILHGGNIRLEVSPLKLLEKDIAVKLITLITHVLTFLRKMILWRDKHSTRTSK